MKYAAKPGPKSLLELCKAPKGAGLKARMVHRYITECCDKDARAAYRKGFNAMWRFAPRLMRKWKVPESGQFDKLNVHGGRLWGGYTEWHKRPITALRIAHIFEECALNQNCSNSVLCQISKTMSYLYLLETGIPKKNWKSLPCLKITLKNRKRVRNKSTVKPDHVPTAHQLAHAFTQEWRPGTPKMPLLKFLCSAVMAWDSHVLGVRPKVDTKKIKDSEIHWWSEDMWYTEYVDGRAKLPNEKSGTRRWSAWRVCLCKDAKHVAPPKNFFRSFDDTGNTDEDISKFCTTCPVFAGQVLKQFQDDMGVPFHVYRKPLLDHKRIKKNRPLFGVKNVYSVTDWVIQWFEYQNVSPVSRNSGRKCLAAWLSTTGTPYNQGFHVHADLEKVWRDSYQPGLPPDGYKIRVQSLDPVVATAAHRNFRKLCGRSPPPPPPRPGMTKTDQVLQFICANMGWTNSFDKIFS